MGQPEVERLTGLAPDHSGVVPSSPGHTLRIRRSDLPMLVEYEGRHYMLLASPSPTKKGLYLNGARKEDLPPTG